MPKLQATEWIWMDGKFIPWEEAKIHILSHVIHYGTGAFEGIRCYDIKGRRAFFRLRDHILRIFDSCKMYWMEVPFTVEQIEQAVIETVVKNGLRDAYVRPLIFRGFGEIGVNPLNCPVQVTIAALPFVKYLGPEATEKGATAMFSSWHRPAPNTFPALAKVSGNYCSSVLIKVEAIKHGYEEGIALSTSGHISECSGEAVFLVDRSGVIRTSPIGDSILQSITRDCVITIGRQLRYKVMEESLPKELAIVSKELFLAGTWAELTPIVNVSGYQIGNGKPGPITQRIRQAYSDITSGYMTDKHHWLTYIN